MVKIAIIYDDNQTLDDDLQLDEDYTFDDEEESYLFFEYTFGISQVDTQLIFMGSSFPIQMPEVTSHYLVGYDDKKISTKQVIGLIEEKAKDIGVEIGLEENKQFSIEYKVGIIENNKIKLVSGIGLKENKGKQIHCLIGLDEEDIKNVFYQIGIKENEQILNKVKVGIKENEVVLLEFEIDKVLIFPLSFKLNYSEDEIELNYIEKIWKLDYNEEEIRLLIEDSG